MKKKSSNRERPWTDPDDAPEWTDEMFARAKMQRGDTVLREASGTISKVGRPKSDDPKQQITLRLDRIVLDTFRDTGPGWQSRINAELRKALGI